MYIKTSRVKLKGKIYEYKRVVQGVRVGSKIKHKVIAYLGRMEDPNSAASFLFSPSPTGLKTRTAKLYALPLALNTIMEDELSLSRILTRVLPPKVTVPVAQLTKLMIMGRIISPDSKLSLTRWYQNLYTQERLPKTIDVHRLYTTLDYLIDHKEAIEKELYQQLQKKRYLDTTVVFYDLTSSYFEGSDVEMAHYGYSRDHRPDRLQITLGLVIDKTGLPLYHEVYAGNMQDKATVTGILKKLHTLFEIQNVIFVADKGMLTPDNLTALQEKKYQSILSESSRNALSQAQRKILYEQKDTDTFTKKADNLWYTQTQDSEGKEIIVCYNQYTATKAKQTRDEKIKKLELFITQAKENYEKKGYKRQQAAKEKAPTEQTAAKQEIKQQQKLREMLLAKLIKSHARKYFETKELPALSELFVKKQEVIDREEYLDGMWVIRSNTENLTAEQLITTYKDLKTIEASFRIIKDVIELRPIYHHKNDRIKGHVFICILAFLVTRILEQKTKTTIKTLKENHMTSVIIPGKTPTDPQQIIGGEIYLQQNLGVVV